MSADAALRETGESVDYGCGVSSCRHESSITEGILCYSSRSHRKCCKYTWKGVSSNILLRLCSKGIGSGGLWPQLVCCAPDDPDKYCSVSKGPDDYHMIPEGRD
jgi:hypothetical protein